jgi:16S rRNA (adenine1518-N6/adenine1519-N6)-dimethyltransferase
LTRLSDLPPLRDSLAAQGFLAKKSFGQHFLLDLNITRKIARVAGPLTGCAVLEIGPGPGGLTRALLESDAAHIIAVEKDRRFIALLQDLADVAEGRLTLVEADALDVDEAALLAAHAPGLPSCVIANLPYNVGTPLLIKWLTGPYQPQSMTLMFQREVADRIAAPVKDEAYGRLAVICQLLADTSVVMNLPPQAFTPPPRVHSAVVRLNLRADRPSGKRLARLEDVTRHAFGQRRKMLRSSLKAMGGEALCDRAGVDPALRAEDVSLDGFLRLADAAL